ncbi:protein-L-isoaspartate O-methyltransferase family protein [Streptomyces botrytidirepellens]|uniref:Protein-L-isoaspartate O-methyltransferase n=1 Tax=Streptomyces botrytidirepellens TaxID=2486417 RepID=A0A3M8X4N8_9ACTN|nr:methyltransferase domain-containing protein [Streptomyces botrytidirepellens]RNG37378.1 protein-L-isoaspartate O-methyltransferase [Streptomyces botrytidirepellens]
MSGTPTAAASSPGTAGLRTEAGSIRPCEAEQAERPALDAAAARAAMVAQTEEQGVLGPGLVRDALMVLPREVLMPQAYVRRSAPGEKPPRWDLLDWAAPQDRPELVEVLYGGASVLVQHDGEPLLGRARGSRSGAAITSMSTVMSVTAVLLEELDLRPGQRVLDVGTGAGVTAAVACQVCGDQGVVTLDRDRHLTDAAAVRLADLGFRPEVVHGSGEVGCPGRGFDRIFVSYTVERVPTALIEQLAPGGKLLVHVTTASPSWPALAIVERTADGQLQAELRAVEFAHRAGHGMERIFLTEEFRQHITTAPGARTQRSTLALPADTDRGLWLAADHLLGGGLVRDFSAEHLVIGAPGCGSWLRVKPVGHRRWSVITHGPRDIWREIQALATRWRAAGSPDRYRLLFEPDGGQRAVSACGRLSWHLPTPRPLDDGAST